MKLGLLTDVHEYVDRLRVALDVFRQERVDQVVFLGDATCIGEQLEETCRLLQEAGAIGVWGNHELGLCHEPDAAVRARYPGAVMDFMSSLRPSLELGECHFSHVEPWLDPRDPAEINYFEGPPDSPAKLDRIFAAVPQRLLFAGHYHRWLLATPETIDNWTGERPVRLTQGRYFVVVGAVCDGRFAILDTDTAELTPFNQV